MQASVPVVIFLTRRIPETQVHGTAVDHNVGGVVVENGRNVLPGESVGSVTYKQAGLTNRSVTDNNTFYSLKRIGSS